MGLPRLGNSVGARGNARVEKLHRGIPTSVGHGLEVWVHRVPSREVQHTRKGEEGFGQQVECEVGRWARTASWEALEHLGRERDWGVTGNEIEITWKDHRR